MDINWLKNRERTMFIKYYLINIQFNIYYYLINIYHHTLTLLYFFQYNKIFQSITTTIYLTTLLTQSYILPSSHTPILHILLLLLSLFIFFFLSYTPYNTIILFSYFIYRHKLFFLHSYYLYPIFIYSSSLLTYT